MKILDRDNLIYLLNDNIQKPINISLAENIPNLINDQLKNVKKPSNSYLKYFTNNYKRLIEIREINNVKFIDDSFATNNYSLFYSLEKINNPIIWISLDKPNNYINNSLAEIIQKKIKIWITITKNKKVFNSDYSYLVPEFYSVKNLSAAVRLSFAFADPNDIILLAPNKSNINSKLYSNKFKNIVNEL